MKRMKIYLVAAFYCLVVSCTTSKKIEKDDDFATEATEATASEPSSSTADVSEFDLDEKKAESTAPSDSTAQVPAEKDEFADFDTPAAPPADNVAANTAPAEKDEFAEFENLSNGTTPAQPTEQTPPPAIAEQSVPPIEAPQPPVAEPVVPETQAPPVAEVTPPPAIVPEAPKPEPAPVPEPLAKIEQIFYKPNQNGGAVTIEGDRPLTFTTRLNSATNQLVVEVQNSVVPSKLKRSLNTKDMASSIGSVDIYQKTNSKVSRFVVQLRPGSEEPLVQPEGNSLIIIGAANKEFIAKQKADAERATAQKNHPQEGFADLTSDGIMGSQSLEEFLAGNQKFYGKKISIETNNLDVKEAVKFIAEESGANILMDDGLEGRISLRLRQVPWDQALILILKAKKLGYVRQGTVLRIAKQTDLQSEESEAFRLLELRRNNEPMIVRRFFISYAKLDDIQVKIRNFILATSRVGAEGASEGSAPVASAAAGASAPAGQAGAAASAANAGAAGRQSSSVAGRVIADERTGSLIVTDTKDNMDKIEKLIAALDTQPKQIVLETRIINATENFSKSIGFNWISPGSTNPAQNSAAIGVTTQPKTLPSTVVNSSFSWKNLDVIGNLDAIISLGEIQDKVKVLNTQRTTVTSGKSAQIGAQSKLRIPVTTTSSVGGSSTATQNTSSFDTVTYGLKGTVLPQASNENTVSAEIDLQQIALTNSTNGDTTENQIGGRVVAQSGQTIAVNASFQSRNATSDTGVPGLRDVPVLGMLFKGKTEDLSKSETLVFITMTILEPVTGIFKKAAGEIITEPKKEVQ